MSQERWYPEERAGPFPAPPATVVDGEERSLDLRAVESAAPPDALVEMYLDFDPADRAQGLPPGGERRVREWLGTLFDVGLHVVASHDGRPVGHAVLVSDDDGAEYELAIFVHEDYRSAGVGTAVLRHLLGHGARNGVERVWLTVERWNRPAISLYESVGFETVDARSFEREMALRLDYTDSTG